MNLNIELDTKNNKCIANKILGETNYYIGLTKVCARCGNAIIGYPAISRKDNKTEICSNCGTLEALEKVIEYKKEGEKVKILKSVTEKLRTKYKDTSIITVFDNFIMLQYLVIRNGTKEIYKTLYIKEFEGKLKITVYPDRLERVIEVSELDDIILTIHKQSNPKEHTQEEIQQIKEKYVAGTKVELVKMYDLIAPVPEGTKGIVQYVDDIGTIHINWETGSSLGLVVGTDEFKIVEE